ncbi:MAG: hypothetical protein GY875_11140 [Gammaproteobacteria bacterium]|nr:hypothetical protein [Gammaproteobacteria bacterium]
MYVSEENDSAYQVHYRSYRLAIVLLLLPPVMLFELGPGQVGGDPDSGELTALILGVLLPLIAAYFLIEFASFSFSRQEGLFRWRWRNLLRHRAGEVPLERIVQVRREAIESGDSAGNRRSYRLVVILDDNTVVGLTRSYSGFHDKKLDAIVEQIREYLGHIESLR